MRLNNLIKNQQFMFLFMIIAVGLFSLWVVGSLSSFILASIVLAFLFNPVHVYFTKIGVPKGISVITTFLIALLIVILFLLLFIPLFVNEAQRYISQIPNFAFLDEPIRDFLGQREWLTWSVDSPIQSIDGAQSLLSDFGGFAAKALSFGISRIQETWNLLLGLTLIPIFLFFWLWDTDTLSSGFSTLLPKKRKFLVRVWNETNKNVQNYFKGKFIEVIIVAIAGSLMFWALGLESPILVGITLGLSQLIPFFGPVFMTFPILLVSLAQFGFEPYVLVILFAFAILQFIDGNIFLPFLMSGVVKLPAVVVLLSVFFFGALFGIWGIFFAVPLSSFIKSLMDNWKYLDS